MAETMDLLRSLRAGMMPWPEYERRVADGQLVDPGQGPVMRAFEAAHPEHPMTGRNRTRRAEAANGLRDAARERTEPFPPATLEVIHACLLDCCAAVRSSLALALFQAGDESSVSPLTELLRLESSADMPGRSNTVRRCARAALGRCATRGEIHSQPGRPTLLSLGRDVDLAAGLDDLAKEHRLHHVQSHTATDLIGLPAVVQVVDPAVCRADEWATFRSYLEDLVAVVPDLPPESMAPDETPLLLLNCPASDDGMVAGLAKPEGTVFRFGANATDTILHLLSQALADCHGTGMEPVTREMIRGALDVLQR